MIPHLAKPVPCAEPVQMRTRALLLLALSVSSAAAGDDGVDYFEKRIRPLLEQRCLECHSTARGKVKGGLDLDSKAGWEKGGDTGPAIIPGDAENSLLMRALHHTERDLEMPPDGKLPEPEIALLAEWIRRGAPDPRVAGAKATAQGMTVEQGREFWAWKPPVKPSPPEVAGAVHPVDQFVRAKAAAKGLTPAGPADAETLCRRLHFVLTGLPPSPEDLDAFCQDYARDAATAISRRTDRLMQSPHYAEEMGRRWLDLARFAESSGGGRTLLYKDAWRYRDWVIQALRSRMPVDRFLQEQIAGDLLPTGDAAEQNRRLTATGFLCFGPTNYEEQDKQQLRFDIIDEQIDTIGKVMMGQTLGCARCHDHKFDPISQRDYYALAGIFSSTKTLLNYTDNVARWIDRPLSLPSAEEQALAAHEAEVKQVRADIQALKRTASSAKKDAPTRLADLPGIVVDDAAATQVGEWKHSRRYPGYIGEGYLHDDNQDKGRKTLTFTPKLPRSGRYEVRLAWAGYDGRASKVAVEVLHADGEETVVVDQSKPPADGVFVSLGTWRFEADGAGFVMLSNGDAPGYVCADAVQFLPEDAPGVATAPPDAVADDEKLKALQQRLKELEKSSPARPVVMSVMEDAKPADTELRIRGMVHQKGEAVPRGFPAVGPQQAVPEIREGSGRLELAQWLTAAQHPLTARVFVNRVWCWLTGTGLVRTVDNFGVTGELPTHPELLDWLAVSFVEQGWSLDWLVRTIITSQTWQQASGSHPADPDNRLLTHSFPRRLEAEQLRDALLAASGELDRAFLGPNIAGAGEIDANDTSAQNVEYRYEFKDLRRSVYTPAFRNRRLEMFEVFDFGNINTPQGARNVSNVAPQALFLLNSPWVTARAARLAETLSGTAPDDVLLQRLWRITLQRAPLPAELAAAQNELTRATGPDARRAALTRICQGIFASIDFRMSR